MSRRRTKLPLWILITALLLLVTLGHATHAARKNVIKLTTLVPKGSSYHRSLQRMGQAWRESSGGDGRAIFGMPSELYSSTSW